jgi:hypothetical protein
MQCANLYVNRVTLQVYNYVVKAGEVQQPALNAALGEVAKIGFAKAMQNKWVSVDKETKMIKATAASIKDEVQELLQMVHAVGSDVQKLESSMDKKKLDVRQRYSPYVKAAR